MKTTNQTMKPQRSTTTSKRKTRIILMATAALAAFGLSASAQLAHYYQFSTGTANDQVGAANGTLVGTATITGGALVTDGGNGSVNGTWSGTGPRLTLDSSAVSGITGAFTIEDWFTCTTGWPKYDSVYAFSDNTSDNYLLATPVRGYSPWPSGVGFIGAGGLTRSQIPSWDLVLEGIYLDTPVIHQTVLTYDGTDFKYYVDGVLSTFGSGGGPISDPGFNLSSLTDIGLGGGSPYNDPSLTGSTYSFAIFNQSLTADQVAAVFGLGDNASVSQINAALVPEPGSIALLALAGVTGLFFRRSLRSSLTTKQ
jgi:hypothetical protein